MLFKKNKMTEPKLETLQTLNDVGTPLFCDAHSVSQYKHNLREMLKKWIKQMREDKSGNDFFNNNWYPICEWIKHFGNLEDEKDVRK